AHAPQQAGFPDLLSVPPSLDCLLTSETTPRTKCSEVVSRVELAQKLISRIDEFLNVFSHGYPCFSRRVRRGHRQQYYTNTRLGIIFASGDCNGTITQLYDGENISRVLKRLCLYLDIEPLELVQRK
ncbi:hypothetical protein FA13DRAFT_1739708, partial [Coprinellus micaceus]